MDENIIKLPATINILYISTIFYLLSTLTLSSSWKSGLVSLATLSRKQLAESVSWNSFLLLKHSLTPSSRHSSAMVRAMSGWMVSLSLLCWYSSSLGTWSRGEVFCCNKIFRLFTMIVEIKNTLNSIFSFGIISINLVILSTTLFMRSTLKFFVSSSENPPP